MPLAESRDREDGESERAVTDDVLEYTTGNMMMSVISKRQETVKGVQSHK